MSEDSARLDPSAHGSSVGPRPSPSVLTLTRDPPRRGVGVLGSLRRPPTKETSPERPGGDATKESVVLALGALPGALGPRTSVRRKCLRRPPS